MNLRSSTIKGVIGEVGVAAAPGEKLTIMQGDIVRINVAFDYRGLAVDGTLYCAIGKVWPLGIFDEIAVGSKAIHLNESFDFVPYTAYVDIDSSPCSPQANYDISAKISEYIDQAYVEILNVIDVVGAPEFRDFEIISYDKL
ncbi:hypothetical protein ES703_89776 [subsurface metagenome]